MKDDHQYILEDGGPALRAYQLTTAQIQDLLSTGLRPENPEDGPPSDGEDRLRIELAARAQGLSTAP